MKTRIFRALVSVLLVCTLAFSMTGCEKLDYRRAIELYNAGKFEAAGELLYALGDYEDCPALYTDCQYWIAATLAEQGDFEEALPRFEELGNYENSDQWVIECKYQMAVTAFNEERWEDARNYFAETPDYKNTQEYLRRIAWESLFEEILQKGVDQISASAIEAEYDGKTYIISAVHGFGGIGDLELEVFQGRNDDYNISDGLKITLTQDSTVAQFYFGRGFGMDYLDTSIGSSQTATGKIDITTCTPETRLVIETYEKDVDDNRGNHSHTTDPEQSNLNDAMAENLHDLLTVIPELLAENGITVTLQDIGFYAL